MNTKLILPSISGKRVFVGLSGGVDSAVSAALLKQQGFEVTGCFIKAWQPEWLPCTWREERRDAMRVCLTLNIPFLFFDMERVYKEEVVDKMLSEYKIGRTPNPDVLCNREIKFGAFWNKAREMGADFIATGHYAQNREVGSEKYELREGKDREKDQSYFLWTLTQDDLSHTIFPIGHLEKSEVRRLAVRYGLSVAKKKDSQGVCFIGDINMEEFLSHYVETKPGKVLNTKREIIGNHRGLVYYTIGERHGFDVDRKNASSGPFYVVVKDVTTNTITVSDNNAEILKLSPTIISLESFNSIDEPEHKKLTARIRYRGEKIPCALSVSGRKTLVEFKKPVPGLSLGQSIVFYDNDQCLGGATMSMVWG